ncbi:hypothetical protein [Streptomyces hainanensis]|uniref:hypothetical protein n=1 Tax=Streptomyces hainanensis TaxID=402648 RepID=UPI001404E3C2|nr:hypothetical protein [Streptomyces hainanensis]
MPTPAQDIQWVAIPAGLSAQDGRPRVSLFVAPRLRADAATTLHDFPDFRNWPERLAAATFRFVVTDTQGADAGPAFDATPDFGDTPPDGALWQRLFPERTPVEPFTPDDRTHDVYVSYPAAEVAAAHREEFAQVAAAAPRRMPTVADMTGPLRSLAAEQPGMSTAEGLAAAHDRIAAALTAARERASGQQTTRLAALARGEAPAGPQFVTLSELGPAERHLAFHRPARPAVMTPAAPRPVRQDQTIDFHRILAALGDHPFLLRRLGLVLDLLLPAGAVTPDGPGERCLRAAPTFTSLMPADATRNVRPCTSFTLRADDRLFAAASQDAPEGPLPRGLLALPDPEFSLEQSDIDGAALKTIAARITSTTVAARTPAREAGGTAAPAAPAARTKGIALVHNDRARALHTQLARAAGHEAKVGTDQGPDPVVVLHAEDLVRGHRVDVRDERRGAWFSLHQRNVTYSGPDGADVIATHTDEGFAQDTLVDQPDLPGVVTVHEHAVTWDGWSLSAPRPAKVLPTGAGGDGAAAEAGDRPEALDNRPVDGLPLRIETTVRPGSLPRLRFGHGYRVRLRTVDLAGNGLTPAEADTLLTGDHDLSRLVTQPTGEPEVFQRFDPVPPPAVVPRFRLNEAESEHRMVIRSDADVTAERYAARFNDAHGGHPPYRGVDERHLVAPRASLECVERHGKLDADMASQDRDARRRAYDLAVRESGRLDDPSLPGVEIVTALPGPDGSPGRTYPLHTGEQAVVRYLPDPASTGVVVLDLPSAGDDGFSADWDGTSWHEPGSLRLRLVEGEGPHQFDPGKRVLTVPLPKAAALTLRVCSRLDLAADEPILGTLTMCQRGLGTTGQDAMGTVREAVAANQHWMVTPWQEITLVHAVQRPLAVPVLAFVPGPERPRGDTAEYLTGTVDLDAASTERIDILAEWTEPVDDGRSIPLPPPLTGRVPVCHIPLAVARNFASLAAPPDPLPCGLDNDRLTFDARAAQQQARAGGADTPSAPPIPAKHEFGDTRHRLIRYHPVASSAFADHFPASVAGDPDAITTTGQPVEHVVLSSAPPAAPHLLYCVPTIGFEDVDADPGTTVRRRRGGGLRIYLGRPWFSSGDGELLGVLLHEGAGDPPSEALPFVTLTGRDPIHQSADVSRPSAATFAGATAVRQGVPLAGAGLPAGFAVTVVGYAPEFDADTNRWFCDLDLDPGAGYLPFLRLALARFQPNSVTDCHLSPVVLSEVVRLLPERLLTVVRPRFQGGPPPGRFRDRLRDRFGGHGHHGPPGPLSVRVEGPSYVPGTNGAPRVVAVLERRDPDVPDDALGWVEIPESRVELARQDGPTGAAFTGELPVAGHGPDGDGPVRLMVFETEGLRPDSGADPLDPTEHRVVYSDVVPLGRPGPGGPGHGPDDGHDGGPHDGGPHGPGGGPHGGPGDGGHGGPDDGHDGHGGPGGGHGGGFHPFGGRGGGGGGGGGGGHGRGGPLTA